MSIEERFQVLEKKLASARRRSRLLTVAVVGGLALVMGLGATPEPQAVPEVIRAERFELVDGNGTIRGELAINKADTVGFLLYDEKKKPRFGLTAFKAGTDLIIYDGRKVRAVLGVGKAGPRLTLHDEEGKRIWKAPR